MLSSQSSDSNSTCPPPESDDYSPQQEDPSAHSLGLAFVLTRWMWFLWPPAVVVMGTFGNIASVLVLRRLSSQGRSPVHLYLAVLAMSDLTALCTGVLRYWVLEVGSWGIIIVTPVSGQHLHGALAVTHIHVQTAKTGNPIILGAVCAWNSPKIMVCVGTGGEEEEGV